MATTYAVLRLQKDAFGEGIWGYEHLTEVEATNADQARRKAFAELAVAEQDAGVELVAVPERSWRTGRGALKAETTRRIRSA